MSNFPTSTNARNLELNLRVGEEERRVPQSPYIDQAPSDGTPRPYFQHYATYDSRLATFAESWPSACPINPHDLAEAGLFYTGSGDKVQCAYCRGKLYNWGASDVAFLEHAKHFPRCAFVIDRKRNQLSESSFGPRSNIFHGNTSLNVPAVQILKEEGYTEANIQKAVAHMVTTLGVSLADVQEDILRDVLNNLRATRRNDSVDSLPSTVNNPSSNFISPRSRDATPTTIPAVYEVESTPIPVPLPKVDQLIPPPPAEGAASNILDTAGFATGPGSSTNAAPGPSQHPGVTSQRQVLLDKFYRLKEEQRQLRQQQLCRDCGRSDANTLYLPCRHLVACSACADNAVICVFCQQTVLGSVKTFRA